MNDKDPFDLQRFLSAQRDTYGRVLDELRAGAKRSHWIWYIFPQLRGLGSSPASRKYAIADLAEARAYLDHPVLGGRLRECTELVLAIGTDDIAAIFPWPDDMKFRSCMTLFQKAAADDLLFARALAKYFDGAADPLTLQLLSAASR